MLTDACKNLMLDAVTPVYESLHNGFSATGANEFSGGSPAYARQLVTYAAAAGGVKSATSQQQFNVPAGETVRYIGKWTAVTGGTFLGMAPNGAVPKEYLTDTAGDLILSDAHGYTNDRKIVFIVGATGGNVPGGLTQGTVYYVINATTDNFQVAATIGGAAINLTSKNSTDSYVSRIAEEKYDDPGTQTVTASSMALNF